MPVVNREVVLPVPRERAWELVTEPDELETWLGDDVEFEPEEGAPLRTEAARPRGRRRARRGRGADRLLAGATRVVEWILEDHPGGTRFVVTEHRFAADGPVWGPKLQALAGARCLA